jgi:hypothetical protein
MTSRGPDHGHGRSNGNDSGGDGHHAALITADVDVGHLINLDVDVGGGDCGSLLAIDVDLNIGNDCGCS